MKLKTVFSKLKTVAMALLLVGSSVTVPAVSTTKVNAMDSKWTDLMNYNVGDVFSTGQVTTTNDDVFARSFALDTITGKLADFGDEFLNGKVMATCIDSGNLGMVNHTPYYTGRTYYNYTATITGKTANSISFHFQTDYLRKKNGDYATGYHEGSTVRYQRAAFDLTLTIPQKPITITINKFSTNPDLTNGNAKYTVAGAVYGVYTDSGCTNQVSSITTDANGYGVSGQFMMDSGATTVWVKEVSAPSGFKLDPNSHAVDISSNNSPTVNVSDSPWNDPLVLTLSKTSADGNSNPMPLDNAEFEIDYYDGDYTSVDQLPAAPKYKWFIRTQKSKKNDTYRAALTADYLDTSKSDPLKYDENGLVAIPLGTLTIRETEAPEGYTLDGAYLNDMSQTMVSNNGVTLVRVVEDQTKNNAVFYGFNSLNEEFVQKYERPIQGGFKVIKYDASTLKNTAQGDGSLAATYQVINNNDYDVVVNGQQFSQGQACYEFTTGDDGTFESADDLLPYGEYTIKEVTPSTGYLLAGKTEANFTVNSDKAVVDLANHQFTEQVITGGFRLSKHDADYGSRSQGDTNLKTRFRLTNESAAPVTINGITYQNGDTILETFTDDNGNYQSELNLPYGSYKVTELNAPVGYTMYDAANVNEIDFQIRNDQEYVNLTGDKALKNRVDYGKMSIEKTYKDTKCCKASWTKPENGAEFMAILSSKIGEGKAFATFDDAVAAIKNANGGDVVIDGNTVLTVHEYSVMTTDDKGIATSGDLAFGAYTVKQTAVSNPEIKMIEDSVTFEVKADNQPTVKYTATNTAICYSLQIVKMDSETGEYVTLNGAEFKIYQLTDEFGDAVNEYVTQKVGSKTYDTFKTNSDNNKSASNIYVSTGDDEGVVSLPLTLKAGKYRLEEVKAPEGFFKTNDINYQNTLEFTINQNSVYKTDEVAVDGTPLIKITWRDEPKTSGISIEKDLTYGRDGVMYGRWQTDISKVKFRITALNDIINPDDGSVFIKGGHAIKSFTWYDGSIRNYDQNTALLSLTVGWSMQGMVTSAYGSVDGLLPGDYKVEEVEAPANVPLPDEYIIVHITDPGDDEQLVNTYEKITPEGSNHDSDIARLNVTGIDQGGYWGIKLSITNHLSTMRILKKDAYGADLQGAEFEILNEDGSSLTPDKSYEVFSNNMTYIQGLDLGKTYILKETKAPKGYVRSKTTFTMPETQNVDKPYEVTLIDPQIFVEKVDADDKPLSGVTFRVTDKNGKAVDYWTTNGTRHAIENLDAGETYTLTEVTVPDGYAKAKPVTFTPSATKNMTIKVVNKKVTMTKEDVAGKELEGAKMSVTDANGNVVDSWISGKTAHEIKGLQVGQNYVLHEDTAPLGYVQAKDIPFAVADDGKNQSLSMTDKTVTAVKVNMNGVYVEGAEFTAYDVNGKAVDKWTSTKDGGHKINNLLVGGEYTIKETKVPEGYVKAADYKFVAKDDGKDQYEQVIDKRVIVSKEDAGGYELKGAKMSVTDEKGNVVDSWTSDGKTHYVSGLEVGKTYYMNEDTAPLGYVKATSVKFTVTDDGKDQKIPPMIDKAVTFQKVDMCGTNVEGAEFTVYDQNGTKVDSFKTTTKGNYVINNLTAGETYTVKETVVPEGYVKAADYTFTVKDDGMNQKESITDKQVSVSKQDAGGNELEGAILSVKDSNGKVIDTWTSGNKPHYVSGLEVGKTYTLSEDTSPLGYIKATDISFTVNDDGIDQKITMIDTIEAVDKVDENGDSVIGAEMEVLDKDGNVVDSWTTGQHIVDLTDDEVTKLKAGYSVETKTDDGKTIKVVPLADAKKSDSTSDSDSSDKSAVENQTCKAKALMNKDDSNKPEKAVKNATHYQAVITNADGTMAYANVDLNGNETTHMISGMTAGEQYTIREAKVADGYFYALEKPVNAPAKADETQTMTDQQTHYEIAKVDDNGNYVEGVTLKLTDVTDEKNPVEVELPNKGVTTAEPFELDNVLTGDHTYVLSEVEYHGGLYKALHDVQFTVPHYGVDKTVTVTMEDQTTNIAATKVDDNGEPLSGAELAVYNAVDTGNGIEVAKKEDGTDEDPIVTWTTDGTAFDLSEYLKGTNEADTNLYILREVKTPFGYTTAKDMVFTVTGTKDKMQTITMTDARKHYWVSAVKEDEKTGERLKGAEITVYKNSDDSIAKTPAGEDAVGKTDGSGVLIWEMIYDPDGYYVKETGAPTGYLINNDKHPVELTDDYNFASDNPVVIVVKDTPDESHSGVTGYLEDILVYGGLTAIGVIVVAVALKNRKKH